MFIFIFFFRFLSGKPFTGTISTIGLPNYFVNYRLSDGSLVNVQIMDTAGQERFKSINTSYYRKADCCLLVYDITNRHSFEDIENYFNEKIKEKCKENIQVILLGNKTDLEKERVVSSEEGANFSLKNGYIFMETSCLKNTNVSDAFETLIEMTNREVIKNKNQVSSINSTPNNANNITITKTNIKKDKNKSSSGCC